MSDDVRQTVAELLRTLPRVGADSSAGAREAFDRLVDGGWDRVGLSERLGGAGGEFSAAAAVAAACAASAHSLPLADSLVVSNRVLTMVGLRPPDDARCVMVLPTPAVVAGARLHVEAHRVPWGRWASHFLVLAGDEELSAVSLVAASTADIVAGGNLATEPRDDVTLSAVDPVAVQRVALPIDDLVGQVQLAGALARSIQLAAACEAILELTTHYCTQRRQFGRSLTQFQAVQQELAALKGETACAEAAVAHALAVIGNGHSLLPVGPIATAKTRTGLAAGRVARIGHQLHGAIGITLEYELHHYTRSLWSWRDEYAGESFWASELLADLTDDGATSPWVGLTRTTAFAATQRAEQPSARPHP